MINAVIFDFHGVVFGIGAWKTYVLAGGDLKKDGAFMDSILDELDSGKIDVSEFHEKVSVKLGMSCAEWINLHDSHEVPREDMLEYIRRELKSNYKIGLISNANAGKVTNNLNTEQLALFDEILVSAEVGMLKPDPRIFDYGAEKLGVKPEECVFVDDHEPFLEGAEKVGMKTIHYTEFNAFVLDLKRILD